MTIVKASSRPPRRSSIDFSLKKAKTLANTVGTVDVFSNSHLPGISISNNENSFSSYESSPEEKSGYSDEEPTPKEDLQDLFAAIQNRLKKKTIDQKKAMEMELKKTVNRTVEEMSQKIEIAKNQIDLKLNNMKYELDLVQRDREHQLNTIRQEYEKFQKLMQKSIDKIDLGEKKIHEIREKFISEISIFNRDFEFPKEKIEEIFNSAIRESKSKYYKR